MASSPEFSRSPALEKVNTPPRLRDGERVGPPDGWSGGPLLVEP